MNPTADPTADGSRPVLIYDGDCGFCVYWARYWQKLTGSRVRFGAYQDLAAHYPHVPLAEFRRASQYIARRRPAGCGRRGQLPHSEPRARQAASG